MIRRPLKNWPDCLKQMSADELQKLRQIFQTNALKWPNLRKDAQKMIRLVEKEIALRESPPIG